ncbi:MAG: L-threonylcarbamoyladenylate synthase [Blastocatellia bacterium]|jgi:L-threonylcarbamoyladenylate synthase|nr:L-threonylcarbamoyladenylate synthase [Blastocatellia bacterium]
MIREDSEDTRRAASDVIGRGGVIAFRTDTFYGLGADPFQREAVEKIKQLKGREDHKPILIVISDRAAVARFVAEPTPHFELLARRFWPGPLTLIGRASGIVPDAITAGTQTVGVRLPGDGAVCELVAACGGALTATSANPSTRQPAETAQQVLEYFGESIDLIVDGGKAVTEQPSTVVDVSGADARLVREGVIAWSEIQAAIEHSQTGDT